MLVVVCFCDVILAFHPGVALSISVLRSRWSSVESRCPDSLSGWKTVWAKLEIPGMLEGPGMLGTSSEVVTVTIEECCGLPDEAVGVRLLLNTAIIYLKCNNK